VTKVAGDEVGDDGMCVRLGMVEGFAPPIQSSDIFMHVPVRHASGIQISMNMQLS
jgi:hypothetical protein